jgi:hypothetical protein
MIVNSKIFDAVTLQYLSFKGCSRLGEYDACAMWVPCSLDSEAYLWTLAERRDGFTLVVWRVGLPQLELVWDDGYQENICNECSITGTKHWIVISCANHSTQIVDLRKKSPIPLMCEPWKSRLTAYVNNEAMVVTLENYRAWFENYLRACSNRAEIESSARRKFAKMTSSARTVPRSVTGHISSYISDVQAYLRCLDEAINENDQASLLAAISVKAGGPDGCIICNSSHNTSSWSLTLVKEVEDECKLVTMPISKLLAPQGQVSTGDDSKSTTILGSVQDIRLGERYLLTKDGDLIDLQSICSPFGNPLSSAEKKYTISVGEGEHFINVQELSGNCKDAVGVTYNAAEKAYKLWLLTPDGHRQLRGPEITLSKGLKNLLCRFSRDGRSLVLFRENLKIVRLINEYWHLSTNDTAPDFYVYHVNFQSQKEVTSLGMDATREVDFIFFASNILMGSIQYRHRDTRLVSPEMAHEVRYSQSYFSIQSVLTYTSLKLVAIIYWMTAFGKLNFLWTPSQLGRVVMMTRPIIPKMPFISLELCDTAG